MPKYMKIKKRRCNRK